MIFSKLQQILSSRYPDWGTSNLVPIAAGNEAEVIRGDTWKWGPVVFKIPRVPYIQDALDSGVDAIQLIRQEQVVVNHLILAGLPVAKPLFFHESRNEVAFLVSEYVETDETTLKAESLGAVLRKVHTVQPPACNLLEMNDQTFHDRLAQRLRCRLRSLASLTGNEFDEQDFLQINLIRKFAVAETRLLHMDMRQANILTRDRTAVAIVDWSNAMLGDPRLELAKILESGINAEEFLRGYGIDSPFLGLSDIVAQIYKIDAALFYALLYSEIAPDPLQATAKSQRVRELIKELN